MHVIYVISGGTTKKAGSLSPAFFFTMNTNGLETSKIVKKHTQIVPK